MRHLTFLLVIFLLIALAASHPHHRQHRQNHRDQATPVAQPEAPLPSEYDPSTIVGYTIRLVEMTVEHETVQVMLVRFWSLADLVYDSNSPFSDPAQPDNIISETPHNRTHIHHHSDENHSHPGYHQGPDRHMGDHVEDSQMGEVKRCGCARPRRHSQIRMCNQANIEERQNCIQNAIGHVPQMEGKPTNNNHISHHPCEKIYSTVMSIHWTRIFSILAATFLLYCFFRAVLCILSCVGILNDDDDDADEDADMDQYEAVGKEGVAPKGYAPVPQLAVDFFPLDTPDQKGPASVVF
eukprot:TRINITY_DN2363_c0_g1_i1.p2 TRINITY_DN2363_c0_g1~~TRINITY_DN2363_c0_g1_i1.p2  ORF type:complete len:308 (-),score=68.72 TRINITY_DN2363_c0_g1_i1:103-990(-)